MVRKLGVLSDTHGSLPSAAYALLSGCEHIIHAGDIGAASVLDSLRAIAPVTAVRGNIDREPWGRALPKVVEIEVARRRILVVHSLLGLALDPALEYIALVIHGHTHRAEIARRGGVLYVNPGSATLPRGDAGPTLSWIEVSARGIEPQIVSIR